MIFSTFLKVLLDKADAVKTAFGDAQLCASHIAVAVADFCKTQYSGFSVSDTAICRFEEERVRYLFSKEVKMASFFRTRLSHNTKAGITEEPFDMTLCERIAVLRNAEILTADVVFLCALTTLPPTYKAVVGHAQTEQDILPLLQDVDANIYDYVIDQIENICSALTKKAEQAAAIRDWKPAAKFAEPQALACMFFEKVESAVAGNVITLKIPRFFGAADLKVSIHFAQEAYYIQDNGCALRHLARRIQDKETYERAVKKVCHACWIDKKRVSGYFTNTRQLFLYLQKLIFIAHADLYYTKAEKPLYYREKGYVYLQEDKAEPMDKEELFGLLKQGVSFAYDEKKGLICVLDTKYSLFSGRAAFLVETLPNGYIRISDNKKGKIEGEIFEAFYWNNEDIMPYSRFVSKIAARFGAVFDGRDVYLTDKSSNYFNALVRFFNLAVLLSEYGHEIALPKLRQKR